MSSIVPEIKWKKVSYGQNKDAGKSKHRLGSLERELSNLTCIKKYAGKKPILLFVTSTATTGEGKTAKPTEEARLCARREESFTDWKQKMQVAGKLMTCLRMDNKDIDFKTSRNLNNKKVPVVAIFSAEGELKYVYKQKDCYLSNVFNGACMTVDKPGFRLGQLHRVLFRDLEILRKNEVALYKAKNALDAEEAKFKALKEKSPSAKIPVDEARKTVEEYQKISDEYKKTCKTAFDKIGK